MKRARLSGWQRNAITTLQTFVTMPPELRRVLYTTDAIESLHMRLRTISKSRSHFSIDAAAINRLWLALQNMHGHTVRSAKAWHEAMNQSAIVYDDRFTQRIAQLHPSHTTILTRPPKRLRPSPRQSTNQVP